MLPFIPLSGTWITHSHQLDADGTTFCVCSFVLTTSRPKPQSLPSDVVWPCRVTHASLALLFKILIRELPLQALRGWPSPCPSYSGRPAKQWSWALHRSEAWQRPQSPAPHTHTHAHAHTRMCTKVSSNLCQVDTQVSQSPLLSNH
jgi:hypothetical protein